MEPDSLRNAPLAPYVRRLLPAALAPFMTMLALSVPWLFALEAASASLGERTAGTFASSAIASTPALLAVSAISLGLIVLSRELTPREHVGTPVLALNRRIGTSSFPPPADPGAEMEGADERDSMAENARESAGEDTPEGAGDARGRQEKPNEG
jgi:hypothetical protein